MQLTDFTEKKSGNLVRTPRDYYAFVPHPLPPALPTSWELTRKIADAERALGELSGVGRTLPNPHLLIGPFIRREAVLSSRIEGTQASLSDLFIFEAAKTVMPAAPDVVEVRNYVIALEYGLKRVSSLPISSRLFCELHAHLMKGVRGEQMTPGEFRRSQNWIGPPGCSLTDATFVPPPVEEMHQGLSELENFIHTPSGLPQLVLIALIHYQFETIHPFLDGNGRIGRLLITLLMNTTGLLEQPLLYLSAYFERRRNDYYRLLRKVSQEGAWEEWIGFFMEGVIEQARDALQCSNRLLKLRAAYQKKIQSARTSALLFQLIDELFEFPSITLARAAKLLKVTPRSAQLNIDKLLRLRILNEVTGKQRNRVYVAEEILRAVEHT
jgi:Fic family protein